MITTYRSTVQCQVTVLALHGPVQVPVLTVQYQYVQYSTVQYTVQVQWQYGGTWLQYSYSTVPVIIGHFNI